MIANGTITNTSASYDPLGRSPLQVVTSTPIEAPVVESAKINRKVVRAGLDLDGVVYDFVDSVRRFLVSKGWDVSALPDAQCWEFFLSWGLPLEDFLHACHHGVDHGIIFATGDPLPGAVKAVQRILDHGHEIHIVTDRGFGTNNASQEATKKWLPQAGILHTSLTFSADKTSVATDTFIEDRDTNFIKLLEAGVDAYLIDRPWNAHVRTNRRLKTLDEYADIVLSKVS